MVRRAVGPLRAALEMAFILQCNKRYATMNPFRPIHARPPLPAAMGPTGHKPTSRHPVIAAGQEPCSPSRPAASPRRRGYPSD
jgi:hypothetical protein